MPAAAVQPVATVQTAAKEQPAATVQPAVIELSFKEPAEHEYLGHSCILAPLVP